MSFSDMTAHSYDLYILEMTHNIADILDADVQICSSFKKKKRTFHHLSLKTDFDWTAREKSTAQILHYSSRLGLLLLRIKMISTSHSVKYHHFSNWCDVILPSYYLHCLLHLPNQFQITIDKLTAFFLLFYNKFVPAWPPNVSAKSWFW